MSLWFSHGKAQWSYGGFNDFRVAIAAHEGIDLEKVYETQDWSDVTSPLLPLLNHSDCTGQLSPEDCRQVAARLRKILPVVFARGSRNLRTGYDLALGMEAAANFEEPLQFR